MITLAIPTLTQFARAAACVESALAGTRPPDRVLVIDNSGGQCPAIPGAEIIIGRQPQSVAKAWNDAMQAVQGDVLLCNDDILFGQHTIDMMLGMFAHGDAFAAVGAIPGQLYSCYLLRWTAYQQIGPFDEGFLGGYFEDNDYQQRLMLAGLYTYSLHNTGATHYGSATIKSYDAVQQYQQHESFRYNERRYIRKWGGKPHKERYTVPFNGVPE